MPSLMLLFQGQNLDPVMMYGKGHGYLVAAFDEAGMAIENVEGHLKRSAGVVMESTQRQASFRRDDQEVESRRRQFSEVWGMEGEILP